MSLRTNKTTTTYRTVKAVSPVSPEPVTSTVVSARSASPLPYTVNGYETLRYMVPVQQQRQQQFVLMQQPMVHQTMVQQPMVHQTMVQQPMVQQTMVQQPMVQQVMTPVYLQNLQSLQHLSVSNQDSELLYLQQGAARSLSRNSSSVFSQSSSSLKSPEPSVEEEEEEEVVIEEDDEEEEEVEVEEVEIVNVIQNRAPPPVFEVTKTEVREAPQPTKLDTRYFGELLADVYRKNCDIHSCISEHVAKIHGKKHELELQKDDVEDLLPKGATELTKQQIRYLLQTRLTADKSMRLLLSTFSSLREELMHMTEDLRRLEAEKEGLERDLSFKAEQAQQYDGLLEAVRENNRQLQLSLKETITAQRDLEGQLASCRSADSTRDFKTKELEGRLRALEKENEMLRQKLAGQSSSSTLQIKTEELSRQYRDQLSTMREEKDREIQRLRTQITTIQTDTSSTKSSAERSLQLKISELLAMLEQRQTTITRQEEEIRKLMQERNDSSKNVTKTIITKRYRNQYPMLGLLGDDYQVTSPVKEAKTIVIERTGEMIKQEIITTP
ncbi:protein POF1B isoform X1 [Takifugu flavidus]|uniref:protein POF1B isoform X1 n=2 Tax=Takifugu flavidus TaxID=433684 RepID=UPI00254419D0|nr:protein POF1B isoform X1 [Takifugu flavidus]